MSTTEMEIDDTKNGNGNGKGHHGSSDGGTGNKTESKEIGTKPEPNESSSKSKPIESTGNGEPPAAPNCLAEADVKTPWIAINARFQLNRNNDNTKFGDAKENSSEEPRKPLSFFAMPKFRSKKNKSIQKNSSSAKAVSGASDKTGANTNTDGGTDSANGNAAPTDSTLDDWHELSIPKKRKIWQGVEGLALTIFGIGLPACVFLMSAMSMPHRLTLVLLNHPLETIAELLLLLAIPFANYSAWSAFCNNNYRYPIRRGISMGASIMTCLMLALICVAGMFVGSSELRAEIGSDFTVGFMGLILVSMMTCAASLYIVNRIRLTRDFKQSRLQIVSLTAIGAVLSLITFLGAEFRPWTVRMAARKAAATQAEDRKEGIKELRALNPERELLLECADSKATGLVGLFIPIKKSSLNELYFSVTGKPYSFKDIQNSDFASMPDDYLSRHVVGDKVHGLTMRRSYLSGNVHSRTLSSTLKWTFVFKNDSDTNDQDARAELSLPPGAVINGFRVWRHGEPKDAKFLPSGKADNLNRSVGNELGVVTDLGHGRALVQCHNVQQDEEIKAELSIVVPLKPDGDKTASVTLPKFLATNFDLIGDHSLRIKADRRLTSTVKTIKTTMLPGNQYAIAGELSSSQLENSNLVFSAERPEKTLPVVVLDKIALKMDRQDLRAQLIARAKRTHKPQPQEQVVVMIDGSKGIQTQFENLQKVMALKAAHRRPGQQPVKKKIRTIPAKFVVETVHQTAAPAPKELVVVVDGSATMKEYVKPLVKALTQLPKGIPTHVIVASQEHPELLQPMPLSRALPLLEKFDFAGGQDNLESVVKAAELAGETTGGAILWAHGPLPALNEEVYIVPQYAATPDFYELPLGSGETDTLDFFKNHSEIGPFTSVPRNTTEVVDDLKAFFSKWTADKNGFAVELTQTTKRPTDSIVATAEEAKELVTLHADQQLTAYLNTHHISKATRLAVNYEFLSPVSCALVDDSAVENVDAVENSPSDDLNNLETEQQTENSSDTTSGGVSPAPIGTDASGSSAQNKSEESSASTGNASDEAASLQGASTGNTSDEAASLQGATNGTIGPQGSDATYITGVNTSGTVRVNNLANLEALLNIIANLFQLGASLVGIVVIIHSFARRDFVIELMGQELEISQGQRIAIGAGLVLLGLAFPGLVNWFVASARDANLFS